MRERQFGQHPPATHVVAHISDTHFLGSIASGSASGTDPAGENARPLYGIIETDAPLISALERLRRVGEQLDAIVFTGDIADVAEPDAYRRIRSLVEPVAKELGATLVWVMGNHDEREPFRSELLGEGATPASRAPVDRVDEFRGLRVITLDSTVPGYHHGAIAPEQLEWLSEVLRVPAAAGSVLALHHPPIPTPIGAMSILELDDERALANVVRGSDIRTVLGGHLHYASMSTFAGVPVSVAAATCYTMDLSAAPQLLGVDGGQSLNLVHFYEDRVVHSVVPLGGGSIVANYDNEFLDRMHSLSPSERREVFSRKAAKGSSPHD